MGSATNNSPERMRVKPACIGPWCYAGKTLAIRLSLPAEASSRCDIREQIAFSPNQTNRASARLRLSRCGYKLTPLGRTAFPCPARLVAPGDHYSFDLGWRLEGNRHVKERTTQSTRLVRLHRHFQYCRHPPNRLCVVGSKGPQLALIDRGAPHPTC